MYAVGPLQRSQRAYVQRKPTSTSAKEWCSCCRSKKVYPGSLTSDDASEDDDADKVEFFVRHKSIPMFGRFLSSSNVNNPDSRMLNPRLNNSNVEMRGFNVLSLEPYSMVVDKDTEDTQVIPNESDDSNNVGVGGGILSAITERSSDNTGTPLRGETDSLLASSSNSQFA
jgi:hypothetical protein